MLQQISCSLESQMIKRIKFSVICFTDSSKFIREMQGLLRGFQMECHSLIQEMHTASLKKNLQSLWSQGNFKRKKCPKTNISTPIKIYQKPASPKDLISVHEGNVLHSSNLHEETKKQMWKFRRNTQLLVCMDAMNHT